MRGWQAFFALMAKVTMEGVVVTFIFVDRVEFLVAAGDVAEDIVPETRICKHKQGER